MTAITYDIELPPLDLTLAGPPDPPPARRRVTARIAGWLSVHRIDVGLVAILTVIGGLAHAIGMYASPARFDDEGTYTAYAWAVQNWHTLGHYTYWYAHPPLGWMQIAGWTWLTNGFDRAPYAVAAAREFMFVCKLVTIPLLYILSRRLGYGRLGGALAVAIFALSPLAVYFTRAALLDNVVTPWLVAAFVFAASPRRSVRGAVASAGCLATAVLTKETALLYLPAVVLLLWQHTDRRNRRFTLSLFAACFVLICATFPLYALIKNELLVGPGHVSLEWAVRWQLFERKGSGSIFDPNSTAHAVIQSWLDQDAWLPRLALLAVPIGLLVRRTRAVAIAFAIQVVQLMRSGYLPYPYVIAMIPFAALTIAGVVDWLWDLGKERRFARGFPFPVPAARWNPKLRKGLRLGWRSAIGGGCLAMVMVVGQAWSYPLRDLRKVDRDVGKAQALTWLRANVTPSDYVVVDDSFWVDLVRSGHPSDHVIWFTKLDVDKEVVIPATPQWTGISYVVLDHEDDLSVHLQDDGAPSKDTMAQFPTLGKAVLYSRVTATFGVGLDTITIREVHPSLASQRPPYAQIRSSTATPGPAANVTAKPKVIGKAKPTKRPKKASAATPSPTARR
jgi:hypothetical protein